jgi:hypothetical protein
MSLSRRSFIRIASAAAVALPLCACAGNKAVTVEAGADRTLPLPKELAEPGSQVKVIVPGSNDQVLIWRTKIGFGGTNLKCDYCKAELIFNAAENRLECTGQGCRYSLDGNVLRGPVKNPRKVFLIDLRGEKLHILG